MSRLFAPLEIGGLTLPNRVIVAPMCQYRAEEGTAGDWHKVHLGHLALSGAGLLTLEATAVSPEGRISTQDLGLYSDENEAGLGGALRTVRSMSSMPVAIQLGHAGRKASSKTPFEGGAQVAPDAPGGWRAVAPANIPHGEGDAPPEALDAEGLARVKAAYVRAAERAVRLGIEGFELHMAHGYLLHQFLSPLSNRRNDGYGGAIEGRMRFPLEVFEAVRAAVPAEAPVWVRVSATDWATGGLTVEETIAVCQALKDAGCAAIHVSSGGLSTAQEIPVGPGYQVAMAARIRRETGLPTIAVGLITTPDQAETIVASGAADAVALARAILWNPRWPWSAAAALGATIEAPKQYWRSTPHGLTPPFEGFANARR